MNRWLVTVLIERAVRRGFPRMHRVTFDARWPVALFLAIGAVLGWHWR